MTGIMMRSIALGLGSMGIRYHSSFGHGPMTVVVIAGGREYRFDFPDRRSLHAFMNILSRIRYRLPPHLRSHRRKEAGIRRVIRQMQDEAERSRRLREDLQFTPAWRIPLPRMSAAAFLMTAQASEDMQHGYGSHQFVGEGGGPVPLDPGQQGPGTGSPDEDPSGCGPDHGCVDQ